MNITEEQMADAAATYIKPFRHQLPLGGENATLADFVEGAKWMQTQSQWIGVKDKYPEDKPFEMYRLLGWSESSESEIVCLYQDKCFYNAHKNNNFDGNPEEITDEITHWMPLPEPPKQ